MSDLTKQSELKNCPFCGSAPRATTTGVWWVVCDECACEGPVADSEPEAIAIWNTRPASAGVREALANLLVEHDSEDDDEECELCGGRGALDAYTDRTSSEPRFEGRDEIGCPACIERHHSRIVRSALSDHGVQESAERSSDYERVGFQYLHYSPFTGHEVWLDKDFYNGHRATVTREIFARSQDTKSDGGVEGHAQRATSAATAPRLAASGMGGIEAPAAGIKPGPSDSLLSKTLTEGEQRSIATKQSTETTSAPVPSPALRAYQALFEPPESDAYDNLTGALLDIKRHVEADRPTDDVCVRTIERVLDQLNAAYTALAPANEGSSLSPDGGAPS